LGIEDGEGECFGYQLGRCSGACIGKADPLKYNLQFIQAFANFKLKSWPFTAAIAITENSMAGSHTFIVQNWIVYGEIKADAENINQQQFSPTFEPDIYKILQKVIQKPFSNIQITPLKDISQFLNTPTT
jgi:DNA polymerase-3 subunit epsilon